MLLSVNKYMLINIPRSNDSRRMASKNLIIVRHITRPTPQTSRSTSGSPNVTMTSDKDSSD